MLVLSAILGVVRALGRVSSGVARHAGGLGLLAWHSVAAVALGRVKGADMLIKDATAVASHLPAWFRHRVNAGSFLVMPLQIKGSAIGLIYADKMAAGSITLHEPELVLLRALRDEAVAAFKRGA